MDASYLVHTELYSSCYQPHVKDITEISRDYFRVKELLERVNLGIINLDEHQNFLLNRNFMIIRAQFGTYKAEDYNDVFEETDPIKADTPNIMDVNSVDQLAAHEKMLLETEYNPEAISLHILKNDLQILYILRRKFLKSGFILSSKQQELLKKNISRLKKVVKIEMLGDLTEDPNLMFGDPDEAFSEAAQPADETLEDPRGSFDESYLLQPHSSLRASFAEEGANAPLDMVLAVRLALQKLSFTTN